MSHKGKRSFINRKAVLEIDYRFKIADTGSFVVAVTLPEFKVDKVLAYENCEIVGLTKNVADVRVKDINKPFSVVSVVTTPDEHNSTGHEQFMHVYSLQGSNLKEV